LAALSLEEIIARNFILEGGAAVVVDVVDSSNLERNLYLAVQLLEMKVKVVLALNMIDVARGRHIQIDERELSQLLGVPVVPTNGKKGVGIRELLDAAIDQARDTGNSQARRTVQYGTEVEEELAKIVAKLTDALSLGNKASERWLAVKLLEGDPDVGKKVSAVLGDDGVREQVEVSREHLINIFADPPEILMADARYGFISGAVKQAVRVEATDRIHLSEAIDKVLTNRLFGPLILLLILYCVYVFTFQGSEPLVQAFEAFFNGLGRVAGAVIVLGFVPLIAFMFFAIAILEDTGYMARIAFMLDRVLRGFGLHGASMLALMVAGGLAGGCAVPGIMATRTMREPKERLVTILVAPLMNCGAKLPVYALLIGAFFPGNKAGMMLLLTFISWAAVLAAARVIRFTVLSGPSAPFVLELPPYRMPTLRGLLIHTWERTWMYIKKAGTVILAISVLLWAMMSFPSLPTETRKDFESRVSERTAAFLAEPAAKDVFRSEKDLAAFKKFREEFQQGDHERLKAENPAFFNLAQALDAEKSGRTSGDPAPSTVALARAYQQFIKQKQAVEADEQMERLKHTIGGRLGVALEPISRTINFDWRTNIALVGGFAAKEVVVATLGTAYSLGEVNPEQEVSLPEKLKNEPGWNPLTAFTLILFVMFYAPCFVTLVVMRRETGTWKWPAFAMTYTTSMAYLIALAVYSAGSFFGLGL
ncbi:MAG: ferrous iron transport protein B, partial [Deltaproteobacteria bacterium]